MLQGISVGLLAEEKNVVIKQTALKSLRDSLKFYQQQFQEKQTRD